MAHPPAARSWAAPFEYAGAARDARHAARTWFEVAPDMSPAQYRDQQFIEHCKGRTDSTYERRTRRDQFNQAFAEAVGHIVVEEARLYALPA